MRCRQKIWSSNRWKLPEKQYSSFGLLCSKGAEKVALSIIRDIRWGLVEVLQEWLLFLGQPISNYHHPEMLFLGTSNWSWHQKKLPEEESN